MGRVLPGPTHIASGAVFYRPQLSLLYALEGLGIVQI